MSRCLVANCDADGRLTRGYCRKHYQRLLRTGQPERSRQGTRRYPPHDELFMARVVKAGDGCWLWTGNVNDKGYGQFSTQAERRRTTWRAHRYAYARFVGPIPDGLELDHLCRVRHCVNPDHLEPVTHQENVRRAHQSRCA